MTLKFKDCTKEEFIGLAHHVLQRVYLHKNEGVLEGILFGQDDHGVYVSQPKSAVKGRSTLYFHPFNQIRCIALATVDRYSPKHDEEK